MSKRLILGALLLACWPDPARAFTVGTGFTDPCHERFTMAAYYQTRVAAPVDLMPEPESGPWEPFIEKLLDDLGYPPLSRKESFYFASLLAGVRANDTDGHSTLNLNALRSLHVHPELQYEHFLRAQDDDYQEGNRTAIQNGRQQILDFFELVLDYRDLKPEEQIIKVLITVDFHGEIEVDAWAPAYYCGKALHTMHDTFSHTIRSDDMTQIIHVLNYAEAVSGGWEEERDGLRHSESMDECNAAMGPVLEGVLQASIDLVFAAAGVIEDGEDGLVGVTAALDKWCTYREGCSMENDYCDSKWARRAKNNPTLPYAEALFGCGTSGVAGRRHLTLAALVLLYWGVRVKRRYR